MVTLVNKQKRPKIHNSIDFWPTQSMEKVLC